MTAIQASVFWCPACLKHWKSRFRSSLCETESSAGARLTALLWPCPSFTCYYDLKQGCSTSWYKGCILSASTSLPVQTSVYDTLLWCEIPPLSKNKFWMCFFSLVQNSEDSVSCNAKPTLVAQPHYRLDLFNRQMRDVLFTAVLVTTFGNHTLGHFGTSDGRILQVEIMAGVLHLSQCLLALKRFFSPQEIIVPNSIKSTLKGLCCAKCATMIKS